MTPNNGRISLVNRGGGARRTLIDGLPSGVTTAGGSPIPAGPSGLKLDGQKLYLTIAAGDTAISVTGGLILNPNPSSPLFNSVLELTLPRLRNFGKRFYTLLRQSNDAERQRAGNFD